MAARRGDRRRQPPRCGRLRWKKDCSSGGGGGGGGGGGSGGRLKTSEVITWWILLVCLVVGKSDSWLWLKLIERGVYNLFFLFLSPLYLNLCVWMCVCYSELLMMSFPFSWSVWLCVMSFVWSCVVWHGHVSCVWYVIKKERSEVLIGRRKKMNAEIYDYFPHSEFCLWGAHDATIFHALVKFIDIEPVVLWIWERYLIFVAACTTYYSWTVLGWLIIKVKACKFWSDTFNSFFFFLLFQVSILILVNLRNIWSA